METLAELVARRLAELGWSQERLAEETGMSQEWVSKVKRGVIATPRRDALRKLAAALGVPREEVVMAAGFTTTRSRAQAMLAALSADERQELDEAVHDIGGAKLLKLSETELQQVARVVDTFATAADARRSFAAGSPDAAPGPADPPSGTAPADPDATPPAPNGGRRSRS